MATISLSSSHDPFSAMSTSTRRTPLSNNPNVANSPLRGASTLAQAKQKRSHATIQREELYGQPPPLKKQMLDGGSQRQLRSPSKLSVNRTLPQRITRSTTSTTTTSATTSVKPVQHAPLQHDANIERIRQWQNEYLARFPKMVFYFESISEDLRAKLSKQATSLGAREERFFSNNITHVVTTRPVPTEQDIAQAALREEACPEEQPQTINPSLLLDRSTDPRRRLFDTASRRAHPHPQDDGVRRPRTVRNNDMLFKAREMGKKIWPLEKFQRMLDILLQPDPYAAVQGVRGDATSRHALGSRRPGEEPKLSKLLQHERLNGPSDRDPTVATRELVHFKGPHIYVYDIDEKQKPIMVREYPRVNQKYEGEWPQFRTVTEGRCPFVEEVSPQDRESRMARAQEKERAANKRAAESRATAAPLQSREPTAPKPVIGAKRTLGEMQDGPNLAARTEVKPAEMIFQPLNLKQADAAPQTGFTSRAPAGRLLAGEPVASGVQPSNITSAIRSQMISSASGIGAAKAGTSKEVHGLQRQVLQRGASNSHEMSSRRPELSLDVASSRSTGTTRATSRKLELIEEDAGKGGGELKNARTTKMQTAAPAQKSKRDLKPGYCENCQDKFRDFDEHILSRKHRKFAENDENWCELDELLAQLKRVPKFNFGDMEDIHR
ncbi:hypothetical protein SODALDRAFT_284630 [Sodiomyces alkalinus F11]|uniref:DBF4-type domain-containing protein n=1 Tax=Sodiomyces alkalinus (strain CBS 110278 / VKM F-3762 / F11) TaxID=1314773 RepID=A0A3N2PK18_SODAK|nr:hypothetical protein SODALDRAFT_284630 [Sodiomyces alkalinus F11]ROT34875.1 hypothetical protein SODALDRAFT_284630 [Sodiomyces alkalinus F11]